MLWQELGRLLANEDGLVVMTGGLAGRVGEADTKTADLMIIDGMLAVLRNRLAEVDERIETVLPDPRQDWNKLIRFKDGTIRVLEKRSAQPRRFSMVNSADVVITVEGEHGVRSILDVALAIERPFYPCPLAALRLSSGESTARTSSTGSKSNRSKQTN